MHHAIARGAADRPDAAAAAARRRDERGAASSTARATCSTGPAAMLVRHHDARAAGHVRAESAREPRTPPDGRRGDRGRHRMAVGVDIGARERAERRATSTDSSSPSRATIDASISCCDGRLVGSAPPDSNFRRFASAALRTSLRTPWSSARRRCARHRHTHPSTHPSARYDERVCRTGREREHADPTAAVETVAFLKSLALLWVAMAAGFQF